MGIASLVFSLIGEAVQIGQDAAEQSAENQAKRVAALEAAIDLLVACRTKTHADVAARDAATAKAIQDAIDAKP